jgi:hypothetical protein
MTGLAILGSLTGLFGLVLIGVVVFALINNSFCKKIVSQGKVTGKRFVPKHYARHFVFDIEGLMNEEKILVPDTWWYDIEVDEHKGSFTIKKREGTHFELNEEVFVKYYVSRLSHEFRIIKLFKITEEV